ncbi:hypothetical protein Nepgr_017166 [Nepenthes gracilis]|uniref:DUF1664 domain-containing protein n=1 Tax=Nepenthes gracilis TaxID=150966 RepID=A0AAD3SR25_NEPGR|nr:hypothetical protein Nepgr_017166 [Nepenthes gracilis]
MAMQTGMGLSKIIILFGAGYTGTILLKNGKLSDLLVELQALIKGIENSGESTNVDSDPIAAQVRWLAQEVRQLASARQITVLNGSSGRIDLSSLIIPAGALGALGYGYMWWKGLSFSDLMYVTKRNMATAVENLTKHLESVSEALAKTKRHLTQRIENIDGKVDDVKEIAKFIKNEVCDTRADVSQMGSEVLELKDTVYLLSGRINIMEEKQTLTLAGVDYLCHFVDGKRVPEYQQFLQEQYKLTGKSRGQLTSSETPTLQGLKQIADILSETKMITDGSIQDAADVANSQPRSLMRAASIKPAIKGF